MCTRVRLNSFVEGLEYKRIVVSLANHKGHDTSVTEIQNGAQINLVDFNTFIPFELRNIGQPFFIWPFRIELTVKQIFSKILRTFSLPCATMIIVFDGGFDIPDPADTQDSLVIDANAIVVPKVVVNAPVSLVGTFRMYLFNLFRDSLVLDDSVAELSCNPLVIGGTGHMK